MKFIRRPPVPHDVIVQTEAVQLNGPVTTSEAYPGELLEAYKKDAWKT